FAALAEPHSRPIMLTALHVLDELIKEKRIDCTVGNSSYTGRELQQMMSAVNLYDAFSEQWYFSQLGTANRMLVLPNARLGEAEPFSQKDVAAFHVDLPASLKPRILAARPAAVGDPVWLVI